METKIELLAPAGDMEKLKTAIYFGADAVYFAGQNYGLRKLATNFDNDEIVEAVSYAHAHNVKCYITLNVFARDNDFLALRDYLDVLVKANVDGVIISDIGVMGFVREYAPKLSIHVSTQANTTNKYSVKEYKKLGAERVVLARELSIEEIKKIREFDSEIELEAFVHGAMCISYSGRCLLSNYLTGRDSNHGECVQACRWHYSLVEDSRPDQKLDIEEDERGAYILNSKDLCLIDYIDKIVEAGVNSLKIEGRMKSPYYVATVVNAYRRAIDLYMQLKAQGKPYKVPEILHAELNKASHRNYTTGFMFPDGKIKQNLESAAQVQDSMFMGLVIKGDNQNATIEQRNKFAVGDTLELLCPNDNFNKTIIITKIINSKGQSIDVAKFVQEQLIIYYNEDIVLNPGDILRK